MSVIARQELEAVNNIRVTLSQNEDKRLCPFATPGGKLRTGQLYQLLVNAQGTDSPASKFVWKNKAPPRVQFFAWLLIQDRVQCKANLLKKGVVQYASCEVCGAADETATHIIFRCPFAQDFWQALRFDLPERINTAALEELPCPAHVPRIQFETFVLLCCWRLWKRRNSVVFQGQHLSKRQLLMECKTDATLWRCRMRPSEASVCDEWCDLFATAM
jgi:hypothetical protein